MDLEIQHRSFIATGASRCARCAAAIVYGDRVVRQYDQSLVHLECPTAAERAADHAALAEVLTLHFGSPTARGSETILPGIGEPDENS